ncbi:MAG: cob(I)yrinic acid a,c-diamide adenosyltransferase [Lachnospiraceae bacterium]|nr:cob(I)yrinic acid a,c-diamide adenosyltransferase [Lachnospiraceae bacterium]
MGMIQIYCGDGKGKTSAGVGACVRAAGHGIPVVFAQFLKDDTSGEVEMLRQLPGVAVLHAAHNFGFWKSQSSEEQDITRREAQELLDRVEETMQRAKKRRPDADAEIDCLVVLDEIMAAVNLGLLEKQQVMDFLSRKGEQTEVVLTGRNPWEELVQQADYVSEVTARKHPYEQGIVARVGVER